MIRKLHKVIGPSSKRSRARKAVGRSPPFGRETELLILMVLAFAFLRRTVARNRSAAGRAHPTSNVGGIRPIVHRGHPSNLHPRLDHRAVQGEPGKQAMRARVRQHLSFHLPIRASAGVTTHRSRGYAARAPSSFRAQQILHSLVIHDQHDQVDRLSADLRAPAAAGNNEERRCAPACPVRQVHAAAMLRAKHEAAFHHGRNHGNALRTLQDLVGNSFVGRAQQFIQDLGRSSSRAMTCRGPLPS